MFLDPSINFSKLEADVLIHQILYEHTSSYIKGSIKGPSEIIKASHYVEFFDDELQRDISKTVKIHSCDPLSFGDKIDEKAIDYIRMYLKSISKKECFQIFLGAEHSISFPIVEYFHEQNINFGILQIDAHADLREDYQGNKYSHASVMSRIAELQIPITQIGIRALCEEEFEKINSSNQIHTFYDFETSYNQETWEKVAETLPENIYISLDTDGLNPSEFPSVGTPEPGGLNWKEITGLLRKIFKSRNVVAMDIVECCPIENDVRTQYNLAKLIYRVIGYKFGT
ncbi:MAG: agmatinase [Bacteroidetes bacterium TMED39]|nr:MAG: agmatinase [Bacteroidetes bacterium TMED39]